MANRILIYPSEAAPYGVLCATTSWARDTTPSFQSTGAGSGWSRTSGSDLAPTVYANNGSGAVRVTISSHSLVSDAKVLISGTTGAVYDGVWTITNIDSTHIDLQGSTFTVNPAAKGTLYQTLKHNWLVVGWKTASEGDQNDAYALNRVFPLGYYGAAASSEGVFEQQPNGLTPGASTDEMYLMWQLPKGIKFHHISIYLQTSGSTTGYTTSLLANKVLPKNDDLYGSFLDGNIPGWATRAIISSPTAKTYTRQAPILAKNLTDNTITIFGDKRHIFLTGSAVLLLDSGTDSGSTTLGGEPSVDYTENGEVTVFSVAADLADATLGTIQYSEGPFRPFQSTARGLCTLNIVEDVQLNPKPLAEFDWQGNAVSIDTLNDCPIDGMLLSIPVPGFASPDDLYLLHKWMQTKTKVTLFMVNDAGAIVYGHYYRGRVLSLNKTGGIRKHANTTPQISLMIEEQVNYRNELGWFGIIDADATANSFTVEGDVTRFIQAGSPVYVRNSTANDGVWAASTVTYTDTTDKTVIVVTGDVTDGTDDGYIEVYDW